MKIVSRIFAGLICIINSLFLTVLIGRYTLSTPYHYIFVFIYFFLLNIIIFIIYNKYKEKYLKAKYNLKNICSSILLGILIILSCSELFLNGYTKTSITIQPLHNELEYTQEDSVWISNIFIDGIDVSLANYTIPKGWSYNSEWDDIISLEEKPEPLILNFPRAEKIQIRFAYYNNFAKSSLIKDGTESNYNKIKLINSDSDGYLYEVKSNYELSTCKNWISLIFGLVLISSIIFLIINICYNNKKYFFILYLIILISTFFFNNFFTIKLSEKIVLVLISLIVGFKFPSIINEEEIKKYFSKKYIIGVGAISLYSSFASIGYRLFLNDNLIDISLNNLANLILCALWFVPIILFCLYILEVSIKKIFRNNNSELPLSKTKAAIIIFLIMFIIWEIVLIGYFPANMTSDSIDQWSQAIGISPIGNAHPAFHTIIIKVLATIIESPFWIGSIQIICMSAICTSFLMLLFNRGFKIKWLCIMALIYAIMPNNFMFVTTLWKDIPYSISLLWLTYLLGKLSQSPKEFFGKNSSIIILSLSIICVRFFRHNGIIPYFLMIILLIYITFKYFVDIKFRSMYVLILTVLLTLLINGPIFKFFQVQTDTQSKPYVTMFTALGSAVNKNREFSYETTEILESIMTLEDWKEYYNRFNIDSYSFWHEGGMNLSNVTFKQAFSAYLEGLFKYPDIIIKDRLDGMNLLWDITQPPESFNHRYAAGMWFPSSIDPSIFNLEFTDKENHVYMPDNLIVKITNFMLGAVQRISLADIFIYRSGVYIIIFLILLLYILKNKLHRFVWMIIPFIGNTISWILLLSHQSYRYVYYIAPCVFGICIFIVTSPSKKMKS